MTPHTNPFTLDMPSPSLRFTFALARDEVPSAPVAGAALGAGRCMVAVPPDLPDADLEREGWRVVVRAFNLFTWEHVVVLEGDLLPLHTPGTTLTQWRSVEELKRYIAAQIMQPFDVPQQAANPATGTAVSITATTTTGTTTTTGAPSP